VLWVSGWCSLFRQRIRYFLVWHGLKVGAKAAVIIGFIVSVGPIYLALLKASAWQASFGKRLL
jgi:hypothetical protein